MYSQALYKLVEEAYLKPSTVLSHEAPRDKLIKYEAEEESENCRLPYVETAQGGTGDCSGEDKNGRRRTLRVLA